MLKKRLLIFVFVITFCLIIKVDSCVCNAESSQIERSSDGDAYAVVTDNNDLIFFRSNESYTPGQNKTVTDLFGTTYTGYLYCDVENTVTGFLYTQDRKRVKSVYVANNQTIRPGDIICTQNSGQRINKF